MGNIREVMHKKHRTVTSLDMPAWLFQAQTLPNRNFISGSEKILIDLIRKYGELSKADFTHHTDFSRSKITTCVESLTNKKIIIANNATEYSGGRRSKTFSLNGKAGLLAGDVIVSMAAKKVMNIYDYMGVLGELKAGDQIEVEVLREGKPLKVQAVMQKRQ